MKIAILGAGMVGRTMAIDLSKHHEVTSFDVSAAALAMLAAKEPEVTTIQTDLSNYSSYDKLLSGFDYVITAVPGFMGYNTLEAVIKAKKNVADISFFPENALDLDALAKENNVTAIVDCGVAPGMSNYVIGYHNEKMTITSFECMVGGLPVHRVKPFEYKAPFSPIDVIEEYTRPARLMENGHIVTRPALSEAELIDFPQIGTLESFNTDGLRSILYTMGHIPNMKEKTLRYPGHIDLIRAMMKGGFFSTHKISIRGAEFSPLEFSSAVLMDQWKSKPNEDEFTIMKIKVSGLQYDRPKTFVYNLFDRTDTIREFSSMSRTTGYTCTASLHLIMNKLFTEKGVFPPELVGKHENCFNYIMHYLNARNVIYHLTEE
jgi:saccharopine dehydrogenase-like NADP-dependent oxidoreductase